MSSDTGIAAAAVASGVVIVRPRFRGTATVTVTATDPSGLSARQEFEVSVPNRGPEATGVVDEQQLHVGDSVTIGVSVYFTDPEGDTLSYAAESSREIRVKVAVTGDSLILVAETAGSSTISVTARDAGGLSATQRFRAVVEPIPVPDLVVGTPTVDADSVEVGGEFTLSAVVRNQGEGKAASSTTLRFFHSNNSRITPSDSLLGTHPIGQLDSGATSVGSLVVHGPTDPGTYYYGVCVGPLENESNAGNNCSTAVHVRVWQPNRAPRPVGTIPLQELTAGDSVSLDVARYFDDPDEDTLTYAATPSAPSIATAFAADSTVTVSGVAAGRATIAVTARDPDGLTATQRVQVTVEPPRFPDLVVESPAVDADSIAPGATFTLSAVVRNQGDADAPSPATLRFFLSDDIHITTNDAQVGTVAVPRLDAGATSTESLSVTGPAVPGTYFYGACALPLENESDTLNNCSGSVQLRVWQPNREPRPVGTIRARPVRAGASISLDVAQYFDDPDEDALTYTATSSAPSIATASAAGSAVTVSGVAAGGATITVTARDPDGLTAAQSFEVTVQAAPSPDLVVQFSASANSVAPGGGFTLNATVRNQGSGASSSTTLRYYRSGDARINTADALLGTAAVGRVEPSRTSRESLDLTAPSIGGTYYYGACVDALANESDRSNNCSDAFAVRVSQVNREPQAFGVIPDRAVIVGGSVGVEVADNFTDPDGDALSYSAVSSDSLTAKATAVNSTVTVTGVRVGGATINVTATDPDGLTATQSFAVSVEEETTPLPDLVVESPSVDVADSIEVGARFALSADVRNRGPGEAAATTLRYYRSADATITTLDTEVGTDGVSRLATGESSGATITLDAPADVRTYYFGACVDAVGNESIVGNNCSGAVELRVWRRNRPPRAVGGITDASVTVGNSIALDVTSNFTDPDGDDLRYSVASSAPDKARATNRGSSVTVAGVAQGSATITVTARDPGDLPATQTFDVDVTVTAQPDLVVQSATTSVDSVAPSTAFTLTAVVRNQGSGALSSTTRLRFYRSLNASITAADTEIGNRSVGLLAASRSITREITPTSPTTGGTYYYGACVDAVADESDAGNNCSGAVEVWVGDLNRPPRAVGRITDGSVTVGNSIALDVTSNFSDPDGDDLRYSVGSSAPDKARATNFGSSVTVTGVAQGSATITVTARDPGGLPATQAFDVNVTVAAQPDLVVQSATTSVDSVAPSTAFTLTAVVRNQGSGALSSTTRLRFYRSLDATISTADTEIGNRSVGLLAASRSITREITPTSPATGGTYYYGACVDAVADESDAGNNCSGAVEVWVGDLNRAPQARGTIGDKAVELSDEDSVDPASYFTDPDMDQLTYSAVSSKPDTVSVEVYNDEVQFKGQALGRSTITVTARDPGGLTATQSFRVTVADIPNRAPQVRNRLNDITDAEVGDSYHIQVSIVFTDPDGDDLTYATTNTDTTVATVQLRNDSIFVAALALGTTTMSVTATDPGGLSATDSWDVTVVVAVPETFDIELGFTSFVTETQKEHIRAARDSWASILAATELSDIAFNREVDCFGLTTTVGTVDDHLVLVDVTDIDGVSGTLARAGYCYRRAIGGFPVGPIVSAIQFDAADIERVLAAGNLAGLAFHEMAHGLGFTDGYWEDRGVLDDDDTDPHFTGGLAVAAFNAAGGTTYTGNKVPISSDHSHWRESVFGHEVMTPALRVGTARALSAITIQAMADVGYSVDASLADDYDLPGSIAPGAIAGEPGDILDLRNDVIRGPVVVVGPDGRTIRVIPPPPGSRRIPLGPAREAHIEIRPPRARSGPDSLRPTTAPGNFWRRDPKPASRPGSP